MNEVLIILAIIGVLAIPFVVCLHISVWLDSRSEKRAYRKAKESFDYVARNIEGCQYWLSGHEREPYRQMFMFIVDCMRKYNNVPASELRDKVDEIIKTQTLTP